MNSYYLYIEAGNVIDEDSRFFKISVGTSAASIRDFKTIVANAQARGHYFKKWCREVDIFCENLAKSIKAIRLPLVWLSANEMKRYLVTKELPKKTSVISSAALFQKKMLSLNFRVSSSLNLIKSSYR